MKTSGPKSARKPPARAARSTRNSGQAHGHPLTQVRREERLHPSLRKAKHKQQPGDPRREEEEPGED
jgi:hypothetical protein